MTVKITTPNGGSDSLDFGCAQTAIVATVTGTEVSSGEGKLELKTTTGGTSAAKMTIAANGTVTLAAPLPVASGGTGSTTGAIYLQTAVATTSGTDIDFTGIPSGVKRVTLLFSETSLNGTDDFLIQLGDSGGFETSGYISSVGHVINSQSGNVRSSTAGFIAGGGDNTTKLIGTMTLSLIVAGSYKWISALNVTQSTAVTQCGGGQKSLSAELTQVRITRTGSNTFDAGSVAISYEF
tara:strand:+ start:92 stop:805 length:714 start_codon:yes stop_codon:yes gene_type:complete